MSTYSNNRNNTSKYAKTEKYLIIRESTNNSISPIMYMDNIDIGKCTSFGYKSEWNMFDKNFLLFIQYLNNYILDLLSRIITLYGKINEPKNNSYIYSNSTNPLTYNVSKENTGYEITSNPIINNTVSSGSITDNCYNYVSYLNLVSFGTLTNFGFKFKTFYNDNQFNQFNEMQTINNWNDFFITIHCNLYSLDLAIKYLTNKINQ